MTEIKVKVIGRGTVTQQPLRGGLTIQLQAIPDTGAVFISWGKFGHLPFSEFSVCNVNPNFSGTVVAVFKDKNTNDVNLGETMPTSDPQNSEIINGKNDFWIDDLSVKIIKKLNDYGGLIVNDDGTVLDKSTSLMWTYKAYPEKINFAKAKSLNKDFAGYSDWRVPKLSELKSIIPHNIKFFSQKLVGYYWSDDGGHQNELKRVIDKHGRIDKKDPIQNYELLRLVREVVPKTVIAKIEQITYALHLQAQGSGEGSIATNPQEKRYLHGSTVTLQATPDKGSKFKQWLGDIRGINSQATIKMDGPKTVTAEFVRVYSLTVSTLGKGEVKRGELANEYEADSTVTLTAIPEEGHEFVQWHEAAFGTNPVCTVVMNSSCAVLAEFRPLPVFDLKVTHAGTGSGVVLPNKQVLWQGSEVELIAQAAEGCVFDGWGGDLAEGLEDTRKVTVHTHLAVTATFNRVEVPETDIGLVFDGTTYGDTQIGNATVFLFTVSNRSDRQIQLDIPLAGFVTLRGEEIEQVTWVKGMIDGEKGATLRAGTFRKMGLAFDRRQLAKVALGEHLHLTMLLGKPAQRLTFTFRCTDAEKQVLTLVKASLEPLAAAQENSPDSGAMAAQVELAARMQLLEKSLQEALARLNAPPTAAPKPADAPTQTLPEVLAWLCTQNTVPLAVLRQKLLPLGLMPSAVMDDVNERAFDVAGELALDEAADNVTVQRRVLLQVLAVM